MITELHNALLHVLQQPFQAGYEFSFVRGTCFESSIVSEIAPPNWGSKAFKQ